MFFFEFKKVENNFLTEKIITVLHYKKLLFNTKKSAL